MSWVSPWTSAASLVAAAASVVEKANEYRLEIESTLDSAMGVSGTDTHAHAESHTETHTDKDARTDSEAHERAGSDSRTDTAGKRDATSNVGGGNGLDGMEWAFADTGVGTGTSTHVRVSEDEEGSPLLDDDARRRAGPRSGRGVSQAFRPDEAAGPDAGAARSSSVHLDAQAQESQESQGDMPASSHTGAAAPTTSQQDVPEVTDGTTSETLADSAAFDSAFAWGMTDDIAAVSVTQVEEAAPAGAHADNPVMPAAPVEPSVHSVMYADDVVSSEVDGHANSSGGAVADDAAEHVRATTSDLEGFSVDNVSEAALHAPSNTRSSSNAAEGGTAVASSSSVPIMEQTDVQTDAAEPSRARTNDGAQSTPAHSRMQSRHASPLATSRASSPALLGRPSDASTSPPADKAAAERPGPASTQTREIVPADAPSAAASASPDVSSLHAQLASLQSVLAAREKQLASAADQTARSMDEVVTLQRALSSAEARASSAEKALAEERKKSSAAAKDSGAAKMRDQISALETEVKERDARIADILAEGEGLSKKVGTLEGTIKSLRASVRAAEGERDARVAELRDAEAVISKLKGLVETLEQETDSAKRDKSSASDVALASQSRLAALEEESSRLRGEVKALRSALSTAQKEAEEHKAMVAKALADAEVAERGQHAAEASLSAARSAEAAATRVVSVFEEQVRDLRNQLNALRASSAAREDDLRRELDDATLRLQRAQAAAEETGLVAIAAAYGVTLPGVGASDSGAEPGSPPSKSSAEGDTTRSPTSNTKRPHLSAIVTNLSTPASAASRGSGATSLAETLVAQIASLQGELQSKRDAWSASRAALQARLASAESALESADADVRRAEAAASEASHAAASLRTELITLRGAKARSDAETTLLTEKLKDAESKLAQITFAHELAQRQVTEMSAVITDLRGRVEEQSGARAAAAHMSSVLRDQVVGAQEEIINYKREIAALKREVAALRAAENPMLSPGRAALRAVSGSSEDGEGAHVPASASFLKSALTGDAAVPSAAALQGGVTSAAQATIAALERDRDALTADLVTLTTRVAQLEGAEASLAEAKAQLAALSSKNELLLEMLGEREEELEALRGDLDEVRAMYRIQLEALMSKAVALERVDIAVAAPVSADAATERPPAAATGSA